jgi:regulator of protease activity HflC (stomatin/prohibitin superfamily)
MRRTLIKTLLALVLIVTAAVTAVYWFTFRIYVPENKCAVLIRKMGDELPEGQRVATEPGQKGIQEHVLGPGRYFYNPLVWDYDIEDLTVIPAGDPKTWQWVQAHTPGQAPITRTGDHAFQGQVPMVGVVTRRIGKQRPEGSKVIVSRDSGYEGIWREVLTPGVYKINPLVYEIEIHPAVVIPAGFVGVVTNLFDADSLKLTVADAAEQTVTPETRPVRATTGPAATYETHVRPLAGRGRRGTQRDVLQPGVYFINPKLEKVTLIEIGFNEYSQLRVSEQENYRIFFPAESGFKIGVGVTVVWGIHPAHAAEIVNEFGPADSVLENIIGPQLRSIGRNIGSTYAARDFIQGEKRERFQRELTAELHRVCGDKNIEVLLALVHEIEVNPPSASPGESEITGDLKRTIQQSYIAIENQLTKEKQREAAVVKAQLEEEKKKIDIAQETVRAETRVKVANEQAEGEKKAAEIAARAQLEVATIQQEVAQLEAKQIEILGQAKAAVEKMKQGAEAEGYKLLVGAFGSPRAYNLYTFAKNFEPQSIQLFFAGEGTFWTDLSRFEEAGAARLLQQQSPPVERPSGPQAKK